MTAFEEKRVGGFTVRVSDEHKVEIEVVSPMETITPGVAATLADAIQNAGLAAAFEMKQEADAKRRIQETGGPKYADQW